MRAVGVVRVSEVKGREGDSFASPQEQRDRIIAACERDRLDLIDVFEELDVSGGRPLEDRPGLSRAVTTIEAGEVEVIAASYFDRLFRSLRTQADVLERVERAGGHVLAVDIGRATNGSAGQWLSATMLGAASEYARRTVAERSREAQERAVARGVVPWPNIPPGYSRGADGALVPSELAPIVTEAFRLRADGATVAEVRQYLREHGVVRGYHGVLKILSSRLYIGEVHFGELVNLQAHQPIISRELWQLVQRRIDPRGRRAKSDRLLARLGVLRCGTCGARMSVGSAHNGRYGVYRCPPVGDCPQRMAVSATLVEDFVVAAVKRHIGDIEGRASAQTNINRAVGELDQAELDLQGAIRVLSDFTDETGARKRLEELRRARDEARARLERLGGIRATKTVTVARDWDLLTLEEQRALIRAVVDRVEVGSGRGADRLSIRFIGGQ